jgi:hypothetical protein
MKLGYLCDINKYERKSKSYIHKTGELKTEINLLDFIFHKQNNRKSY